MTASTLPTRIELSAELTDAAALATKAAALIRRLARARATPDDLRLITAVHQLESAATKVRIYRLSHPD